MKNPNLKIALEIAATWAAMWVLLYAAQIARIIGG